MLVRQLIFPSLYFLSIATALTDLDTTTINKLLTALNECTEWGQVFILDSLATYQVRPQFYLKYLVCVCSAFCVCLCCWRFVSPVTMHSSSFPLGSRRMIVRPRASVNE